jgi:hypothetical protein
MSYSKVGLGRLFFPVQEDGLAAANDLATWVVKKPIQIKHVTFLVTTVLGSFTSVTPVLSLSYTASGGSKVEKATVSPAAAQAAGSEVEGTTANMPFDCAEDGTLTFAVKTAGSGGTTTGKGYWILYYNDIPEAQGDVT